MCNVGRAASDASRHILTGVVAAVVLCLGVVRAPGPASADRLSEHAVHRADAPLGRRFAQNASAPAGKSKGSPSQTDRKAGEEPVTRARAITIQPNLGEIDRDGGIQFAPNGKYVAVGNRSQIKLWDIASGRPLRILEQTAYFEHFTFIEQGARILSVHKDAQVRIWDPATGQLLSSTKIGGVEESEHIKALTHHPAHNAVVITTASSPIVIWDYKKKESRGQFAFDTAKTNPAAADGATLSRDGRTLIAAGGNLVKRFDVATRKPVGGIRLRDGLQVLPAGVFDENVIIAKTADEDCDADLVLATISDPPRYATLDPAPKCKRKADGSIDDDTSYDGILLVRHEAKGHLYVARRGGSTTKVLDLAALAKDVASRPVREIKGAVFAVDGSETLGVIGEGKSFRIVNLADASTVSRLIGQGSLDWFPIASGDGRQMMLLHTAGAKVGIAVWPIEGVSPRFHQVTLPAGFTALHAVPDGDVVFGGDDKGTFVLHSVLTGEQIARFFLPNIEEVNIARLSPDGKFAMLDASLKPKPGSNEQSENLMAAYLVETRTGKVVYAFEEKKSGQGNALDSDHVRSFAFSADSRRLALGWQSGKAEIWSIAPPRLTKRLDVADDQTTSLTFSPDNKFLIGGSRDSGIFVWSLETGKVLRTLERTTVAGHVSTGGVGISHDSQLVAAGPRQRATSSGDVGRERRVQVWDMTTGKARFRLSGHEANVNALIFTADGRWLVSGSNDGTIRYWDRRSGNLGATFAATPDGRWVIVTSPGFFAASSNAGDLLSAVRGFEATSIEQLWQSLYAPDLVREFITGDAGGEVKAASANANLAKVLDSGPPPDAVILRPGPSAASATDLVDVEGRITDRGKGIGRIEWRLNGVTAAVGSKPAGAGGEFTITQRLALDAGDNTIELVAYNTGNLLASLPARTTIKFTGRGDDAKPTLHVLAIGINTYVDKGWRPAGAAGVLSFQPLSLAVNDAKSLTASFQQAGAGQYAQVKVTQALDTGATAAGLQTIIERMAGEIHPRDTFVLYAAAHGFSHDGRFYLIPQDYDGGPDPAALRARAIGQDRLQDWVTNRIKAKKSIVLLDTCESGALVGGSSRSRTDLPASEAAMGRLHEATGRPVLTAAAEGKPAFEGFEGHGVFTWALLDALKNGDRNGNGVIELSELVAHVQDQVPRIAARLNGRGVASVAARGTSGDRQSARFGSRGEDFGLVRRLQ